MSGHTPGPWVAHLSKYPTQSEIRHHDGHLYAPLIARINHSAAADSEHAANACLIAAAPALLEALQELFARAEPFMTATFVTEDAEANKQIQTRLENDLAVLHKARAAIALATGDKA